MKLNSIHNTYLVCYLFYPNRLILLLSFRRITYTTVRKHGREECQLIGEHADQIEHIRHGCTGQHRIRTKLRFLISFYHFKFHVAFS